MIMATFTLRSSVLRVTVDSADEAVDLDIRLSEGVVTKIDTIAVTGNKAFSDSVVLHRLELKPGDHLQTQKIREGMLAMAMLYADSGYLSAAVSPEVSVDSNIHVASIHLSTFAKGCDIRSSRSRSAA